MDGVVGEVYEIVQGRRVMLIDLYQREWFPIQLFITDDMALGAESDEQLQCLVTEFGSVCAGTKLRLYVEKSKVVVAEREGVKLQMEVRMHENTVDHVSSSRI